jgi:hypothetical protein
MTQQNSLYKKTTQSLQSYKQRLDNKMKTQYQNNQWGREMCVPTNIISPTFTNSSILFPIRKLLPSQIEQIRSNISSNYQTTDYYEPYLRQPHRAPPNKKIPYYLFSHLSYDFEILTDNTLTMNEKTQLIHLRKIIQKYLILHYSNQQLNARRMKDIINSLESPISSEQYIRPLNDREIKNLLNTLDYLLFNDSKQSILKKIQEQTKNLKKSLNTQLQYKPGVGIKYKQAQTDFNRYR